MTNSTTEDETTSSGKIEFLDHHYPPLPDGNYVITFWQEVNVSGEKVSPTPAKKGFAVTGERFQLKPEIVHSVFPPDGSLGEHSNALPHIILNRSTLPWERLAIETDSRVPWLALLLFTEEEKPKPEVITVEQLMNSSHDDVEFPKIDLESGQKIDDKVTVIDVEKKLLDTIIPLKAELSFLAHVRQGKDVAGNLTGEEQAVIIANRLPAKGGSSTVHLVSVEDRFNDQGFYSQTSDDSKKVRLVSLRSWSFACTDESKSFKGLLINLNRDPVTLSLPENGNAEAKKYLQMGYTLLPHSLRQGEETVSWYHGPLSTGENTTEASLPAKAADGLMRYNRSTGLFDVSYAAAWELGRLLALQSKQFSIDLYNWKRTYAQQVKQAEQQLLYPNLAVQSQSNGTVELPEQITTWFKNLSILQGVPFNYLVPDERMLPKESIRFFYIDGLWVDCLLDGAYSIGRVTTSDYELDQSHDESPASSPYEKLTGFLLRSDIVSGWPGLLVDGCDAALKPLNLLRMDRLSDNVLLCLFEGDIFSAEIHQRPETLHFGLDRDGDQFKKILKDGDGVEKEYLVLEPIPWRDQSRNILDIYAMAGDIQAISGLQSFTSAEFALQMIEGVERMAFEKVRSK